MQGESTAYDATDLARSINSAPPDELSPLVHKAFLHAKVFKALFETFQNDTVSRAKIRQQVLKLKVHPDSADKCVDLFVESAVYAGIASEKDGEIQISGSVLPSKGDEDDTEGTEESGKPTRRDESGDQNLKGDKNQELMLRKSTKTTGGQMNISITLDSTMDPEKLEKYLKLLREYGAIG